MIIGVAGPYSAPTEEQRQKNLDAMNNAAARLLEKGHIPLIGINAALPVVNASAIADRYNAALLLIAESPGANRERDHVAAKGLPVYYRIEDVPVLKQDINPI